MKQIHIIEIESALEAQAIRATAECLGAPVSVTWVANSRQVVEFLSQTPSHELIILCCHGDKRGVLLPPLADEVKGLFPFNDVLTPTDFASFVRLDQSVVLCSGCATGREEIASAFTHNGGRCFMAPAAFPDGDAALLFCLQFLFAFLKEDNVREAFEVANSQMEGDDRFRFFSEPVSANDA